jgi:hypothetical protein
MVLVEKLVWQPAPFQSLKSLGSKEIEMPKSSATLPRRYLAIQI